MNTIRMNNRAEKHHEQIPVHQSRLDCLSRCSLSCSVRILYTVLESECCERMGEWGLSWAVVRGNNEKEVWCNKVKSLVVASFIKNHLALQVDT